MIAGQVSGAKVGVHTVPERGNKERTCSYCGGKMGKARAATKMHAECRREAKRMGML